MRNDNTYNIIRAIDQNLELSKKSHLTAVEAGELLDRKGILKDSTARPGKPLRKILRNGGITHAYQDGNRWKIPHSGRVGKVSSKETSEKRSDVKAVNEKIRDKKKVNKLESLAIGVSELLRCSTESEVNYHLEYNPGWLTSVPRKDQLLNHWPKIKKVYSALTDNQFDLDQQLEKVDRVGSQRFDIWFDEPFYFAIEFDEKQHFNQFRNSTLDFYKGIKTAFDINYYRDLTSKDVNPGKSGFKKLKGNDPLFPEFYKGEKQDNRIRQRAFRDFLKDLLPLTHGYNPTIRLPYQLINKRNNFDKQDIELLVGYISTHNLFPENLSAK